MELADNPKSMLPEVITSGEVITSAEVNGPEKAVVSEETLISDQTKRFQYKTKPDGFIIDMESFSNSTSKEIPQNSRTTRNFSRKGMLRGGNKIAQDHSGGDDTGESISPIGGVVGGSSSTLEKQAVVMGLGSREELGGGGNGGCALSHEIAITTVHSSGGGGAERSSYRRNNLKRSPQPCSWYLDPRKIFLFCATLSCVGTMVLIYFAFSSGMLNAEEGEMNTAAQTFR